MKKPFLYISLIFLFTATVQAQQMNKEKMKLLKTSYITDALDLTPSEAEKFWPIYNLYTDKIMTAKFSSESNLRRQLKNIGGIDNISEKQAQEFIDNSITIEKEIYINKTALLKNLSKVLSAKKIIKLQKAERDFNRQILQEYGRRKRMQGRP